MNLLDLAKKYISSGEQVSNTPEGICPNCWGRQEYGAKFYQAVKNNNMDSKSIDAQKGWIQDYAEKNLGGITLQHKGEEIICEMCKLKYIQED